MIAITPENIEWMGLFAEKYGRPPRILHISNVANNAYNNSKILNEVGIVNHVIAYNDIFAMGCPEWEDADFDAEIDDLWNPNWSSIEQNGFQRPRWFAQGTLQSCADYLDALCRGDDNKASNLWHRLSVENQTAQSCNIPNGEKHEKIVSQIRRSKFDLIKWIYYTFIYPALRIIDNSFGMSAETSVVDRLRKARRALQSIKQLTRSCLSRKMRSPCETDSIEPVIGEWNIDAKLVANFRLEFPDRSDQLTNDDLFDYRWKRVVWSKILLHYDIVVGYAYEGIYPLFYSKTYFAYEHGTIRDIPYKSTAEGRICSLVYCSAAHVFVTNTDCLESAKKLSPGRYSLLNHSFDEDFMQGKTDDIQTEKLRWKKLLNADLIVFHPTRQDWVDGTGYADKANDILIRAIAKIRGDGYKIGLICCEWGANISQSKELIASLGMTDNVKWIKPCGVIRLGKLSQMVDVVADQFKLGAFGGVCFKAMAVSAPVMMFLDPNKLEGRYAEMPPVINVNDEQQIVAAIKNIYSGNVDLISIGRASREWMVRYHGKERTVNLQIDQFRKFVPQVI